MKITIKLIALIMLSLSVANVYPSYFGRAGQTAKQTWRNISSYNRARALGGLGVGTAVATDLATDYIKKNDEKPNNYTTNPMLPLGKDAGTRQQVAEQQLPEDLETQAFRNYQKDPEARLFSYQSQKQPRVSWYNGVKQAVKKGTSFGGDEAAFDQMGQPVAENYYQEQEEPAYDPELEKQIAEQEEWIAYGNPTLEEQIAQEKWLKDKEAFDKTLQSPNWFMQYVNKINRENAKHYAQVLKNFPSNAWQNIKNLGIYLIKLFKADPSLVNDRKLMAQIKEHGNLLHSSEYSDELYAAIEQAKIAAEIEKSKNSRLNRWGRSVQSGLEQARDWFPKQLPDDSHQRKVDFNERSRKLGLYPTNFLPVKGLKDAYYNK